MLLRESWCANGRCKGGAAREATVELLLRDFFLSELRLDDRLDFARGRGESESDISESVDWGEGDASSSSFRSCPSSSSVQ